MDHNKAYLDLEQIPVELCFLILDECSLSTWYTLKITCKHTSFLIDNYCQSYCQRLGFSGQATLHTLALFLQLCFTPSKLNLSMKALFQILDQEFSGRAKETTLLYYMPRIDPPILRAHPKALLGSLKELNITNRETYHGQLLTACAKISDDIEALKYVTHIANGFQNPDYSPNDVLDQAAQNGRKNIIKYIFDRVGLKTTPALRHRLLCSAAQSGNIKILKLLAYRLNVVLEVHNFSPHDLQHNVTEKWPLQTLVCAAARSGNPKMLQHIFDRLGQECMSHTTPQELLLCAIFSKSLDTIKCAITNMKMDHKTVTRAYGQTLLPFCSATNLDIVKFMTQVNFETDDHMSPLEPREHVACLFGNLDIVQYFGDTIPECSLKKYITRLEHAADGGHLDIVKFLINRRAFTRQDYRNHNCKALQFAAAHGHLPVVQYLVETLDLTIEDERKHQVFLASACGVKVDVSMYLIRRFSLTPDDIRVLDNIALLFAAKNGCLTFVRFLFEHAKLDISDARSSNNNILHTTALNGCLNVIQYLVETVGLTAQDIASDNYFAIRLAARKGHLNVVKYLAKKGRLCKETIMEWTSANINAFEAMKHSGDHQCVIQYFVDTFKLTTQEFLTIARVNNNRALKSCAEAGHLNAIKYLIKMGLTSEDVKSNSHKAIKLAIQNNQARVVEYLGLYLTNCGRKDFIKHLQDYHCVKKSRSREAFVNLFCRVKHVDEFLGLRLTMTPRKEMDIMLANDDYTLAMNAVEQHYHGRAGLPQYCTETRPSWSTGIAPHECPRIKYVRHWLQFTKEPVPVSLLRIWPAPDFFHLAFREDFGQRIYRDDVHAYTQHRLQQIGENKRNTGSR